MSYLGFIVHVVPFVQQQFQTLTGIIIGSIMGSSRATLYENEVEAVMMMMMMMMMMMIGNEEYKVYMFMYV